MLLHKDFNEHETVAYFTDKATNLKAIIAIHSTKLGPSFGGCRMYDYASADDALTDVLRLSTGMTYKSALAGLKFGGGKAVVIGNPRKDKNPQLLKAFAQCINRLNGHYFTAADSGTTVADILTISEHTPFVIGAGDRLGIDGQPCNGDTAPATAYGVYVGIKVAVKHKLGRDSLRGVKIAIQGTGKVGFKVAEYLRKDGAELFVADVYEDLVIKAVNELGATAVAPESIYKQNVDVFSPCAMGAILNAETIPQIKAKVIAGSANNQLLHINNGDLLREREILYAPDFAINAGGIIDASYEYCGYDPKQSKQHIESIADTLTAIFERAEQEGTSTIKVANKLAEEKLSL